MTAQFYHSKSGGRYLSGKAIVIHHIYRTRQGVEFIFKEKFKLQE
jgi:hypothetical protein